MDELKLSDPERVILEALSVSRTLPSIQRRARVLLRAAEGGEDEQIAAEFSMQPKDVLHWRKRFQKHGIRGLWDVAGPGPTRRRLTAEKEHAILWEVLYGVPILNWSRKPLALQYRLSRSAVNRIFTKHGIVRDKWGLIDIEQLKVFSDPLFGVTISGIGGLFYGTFGVLALLTTSRPFSELRLDTGIAASEAINGFINVLDNLTELRRANIRTIMTLERAEKAAFLNWLNTIESRRESSSEVYLLTGLPDRGPQGSLAVQEWIREHPHFRMIHAPLMKNNLWFNLVRRCLSIVNALPVQESLVADLSALTRYLEAVPDNERLGFIIVQHAPWH